MLSIPLSNSRAIGQFQSHISWIQDFVRCGGKTFYLWVSRGRAGWSLKLSLGYVQAVKQRHFAIELVNEKYKHQQSKHINQQIPHDELLISHQMLSYGPYPDWVRSTRGPTVYPKKYAHDFCFAVLCCGYTLTDFPISIRLTSLALWQSNDCPSASKATLMNMDKYFMWIHYERLHNHNKAKHNKTVCIFLGIYCIY